MENNTDQPKCYICKTTNNEFLQNIIDQNKENRKSLISGINEQLVKYKNKKQNNRESFLDRSEKLKQLPEVIRKMMTNSILNEKENLLNEYPEIEDLLKVVDKSNINISFEDNVEKMCSAGIKKQDIKADEIKLQHQIEIYEEGLDILNSIEIENLNNILVKKTIKLTNYNPVKREPKSLDTIRYLSSTFKIKFTTAVRLVDDLYKDIGEFLKKYSNMQIMQNYKEELVTSLLKKHNNSYSFTLVIINKIIELFIKNKGEIDDLDILKVAHVSLEKVDVFLCPICSKLVNKSEEGLR